MRNRVTTGHERIACDAIRGIRGLAMLGPGVASDVGEGRLVYIPTFVGESLIPQWGYYDEPALLE